ncbi:Rne/Rng family ribonuclease [Leptolyngbya sp. CCY15150]|uniref:Rne/Rng family ribonuclease n=1 Tax=Leptolyngbya sp. CCY15150 TaxID=2767772 RepID=UPI00194E95C4|nr:Rne/Rng family ribonuclease [Leptolyngbya sp. CCY15150]
MPKQIIIAEQHRTAAVFSEDQIQELIVATGSHQVSDIFLGIVENVLPGIDAAFVNIGDSERNGFIHVSDLGPLKLKRSMGPITDLLVPQQKVLVQVMKEPTGNKGPRLTGNISLPGRYLVLMPFGRGVNLSRRIRNENERNRLRALAILVKPAGMGLLVRTEAEGMDEDAIIEDLELLQRQWENIQQEAMSTRAPSLLNRDDDFIQRVLRDVHSADVNRIVVDSHTGLKRVKQHLTNWSGGKTLQGVMIDHHRDRTSILEYFRVNAAIREALKPRVDLPSGGYIIIEPTEALTVVDVNSGSFTRSSSARETVLWTNYEAAAEIARQLRLRNIAGVIIVDFIDMDSRRDQLQVLEHFNKALRADKARPQIAQLTELGLVELTRKRQGQNIYELFGRTCSTCGGLGHLVQLPGDTEPLTRTIVEVGVGRDYAAPAPDPSSPPQLREGSDRTDDDDDFDADGQDLDLVNHPSYRERNNANNRRRRRRRVVDTPSKGNTRAVTLTPRDTDTAPEVTPLPAKREIKVDRSDRPERNDRPDRSERTPEPRTEQADRSERSEQRNERVERSERSERATESRTDRSRSGRRDKTPPPSPKVVSVEMTLEEQDIYALMGISPLVLSTDTVKDPKNTIISIALPGQENRLGSVDEPIAVEEPGEAIEAASEAASDGVDDEVMDTPEPVSKPSAIADTLILRNTPEPEPEAENDGDANDGDDSSEASDSASSNRRRRRRRSSASSSRRS